MPKTGLKQKTKQAKPVFDKTPAPAPADMDSNMDSDDQTSSDEEDLPEKDDAEKKLERMLFGDDQGFMGALKAQQERADGMQLTLVSDEDSEDGNAGAESGADDQSDLGDMADSDVCINKSSRFIWASALLTD